MGHLRILGHYSPIIITEKQYLKAVFSLDDIKTKTSESKRYIIVKKRLRLDTLLLMADTGQMFQ